MGPLSNPAGHNLPAYDRHEKCQDRERCTGAGCRVRTGKTHHKRTGTPSVRTQAELARMAALPEDQENVA